MEFSVKSKGSTQSRKAVTIGVQKEDFKRIVAEQDLYLSFINNHEKGLNMRLDNRGEELPLGIRRRIGHARSLANNGQIVLFDEPTEGLDKTGKDTFYKLIKNLQKQIIYFFNLLASKALFVISS